MATIKVKIDDEWIEVPSIGISPMAEAPIDGKTYGRKDGDWSEISTGGTQYLDLSMFTGDTGTLSEEDYQKVVKAYEDKVSVGVSDSNYQNIIIQDTGSSYTIMYFIIGLFLTGGMFIIQSSIVDIIKETKAYTSKVDFIQILKSGSGTKALTDNGEYAEFIPEAPADGKTYGRNNKQWVETNSSMQYLDLLMFTDENGTLSEENYQKVVEAYENGVIIGSISNAKFQISITDSTLNLGININAIDEDSEGIIISTCKISINKNDKTYIGSIADIFDYTSIKTSGSGTKALTDNGEYAEFAKPIKLENGGSGSVTKQISPNTFYSFGECSSLTITFGSETSGIVNVYSFEFTSGTNPTTLNLPPEVKFPSGETFATEANKVYEISIRNNKATYQVWDA